MTYYLLGISDEQLQQIRDEIFATRPENFNAFVAILQHVNDKGLVVVMESQEAIDQVNAVCKNWLKTLNLF